MSFEVPIPPRREKDSGEKDSKNGLTRREVLRALGIGAAAAVTGVGVKIIKESLAPEEKPETPMENPAVTEAEELHHELLEESEAIEKNDEAVIDRTFRGQLEKGPHITLDEATRKAIFDNWYKEYSPGTINYQKGLVEGLERMYPWIEDIKKVFATHEVPEKFAYLAIAESNFRMNDVSEKKATGPYQIIANLKELETQLLIDNNHDERLDPVKSAGFCADHLRYSHKKFRGNWNLALLDYNGGFTKGYLKYLPLQEQQIPKEEISERGTCIIKDGDTYSEIAEKFETSESLLWKLNCNPQETYEEWHKSIARPGKELIIPQKRKITEEDFYQYMENLLNKTLEDDLDNSLYTVRAGDTLEDLAKKLHLEPGELQSLNPSVDLEKMNAKQIIIVPLDAKKNVDYLLHILSSFKENINYPGKFHAILKIMEENQLKPRPGEFQMQFSKFATDRKTTLSDIAKLKKISLENLKVANPSILNPNAPLQEKTEIRLPRRFHLAERHKHKRKI